MALLPAATLGKPFKTAVPQFPPLQELKTSEKAAESSGL